MKKLIALILGLVLIFSLSVTAFAAESPSATLKVEVILRKVDSASSTVKSDVTHSADKGVIITATADETTYGRFNSWSIYKSVPGSTTLDLAKEGVDYEIVGGSLTEGEIKIKCNSSVIVCANYNDVVTNPLVTSNADSSANAPQTGDAAGFYFAVIALAALVFGVAVKKQYSK